MKRWLKTSSSLISLIVMVVLASTTPPSGTVIEEHDSSESSSYLGKYQGFQLKQAQQFYLDDEDEQPVTGVGIFLKSTDYGSPSGDVTVAIHENGSGNLPSTLVAGSEQSFTPELGQWNYISFSMPGVTLNSGKSNKYWIVVTVPEQNGENDAYKWQRSTSNTYDRGYRKTFNIGGSNAWETQTGDFAFRIYGDPNLDVNMLEKGYGLPTQCHLLGNYPNPFNPSTTIRYGISATGLYHRISIHIFDVLGHEITTLVDKTHHPGEYSVVWDGCDSYGMEVSSGVYFYKLDFDGKTIETKRMLKMK